MNSGETIYTNNIINNTERKFFIIITRKHICNTRRAKDTIEPNYYFIIHVLPIMNTAKWLSGYPYGKNSNTRYNEYEFISDDLGISSLHILV